MEDYITGTANNNDNGETFGFDNRDFQEPQSFSWGEWIIELFTKVIVLDATVWVGRILVTVAIVLVWDSYHALPKSKSMLSQHQQQQQQQQHHQHSKAQPQEDGALPPIQSQPPRNDQIDPTPKSSAKDNEGDDIGESSSHSKEKTIEKILLDPTAAKEKTNGGSGNDQDSSGTIMPATEILATSLMTTKESNSASTLAMVSDEHPGMAGFWRWYEVETSLYRIYTLTHKDPSLPPAVPPYAPSSQRGRIPIELIITNQTGFEINVFWVDYKGRHVPKGKISRRGGVWNQTTWIDHPWVFEDAATSTPYLYYVPYRAIPTIPGASTMGSDERTGVHRFVIIDNEDDDGTVAATDTHHSSGTFNVGIRDDILPFPASVYLNQPLKAINWTLLHLSRAATGSPWSIGSEVDLFQKYLVNILKHPEELKYRNLKISGKTFQRIWAMAPLRGLLLAAGFVEDRGMCRLGLSDRPLSAHRVQDVALLSYLLSEWKRKHDYYYNNSINNSGATTTTRSEEDRRRQPLGATDGFGRAGFGRAGESN